MTFNKMTSVGLLTAHCTIAHLAVNVSSLMACRHAAYTLSLHQHGTIQSVRDRGGVNINKARMPITSLVQVMKKVGYSMPDVDYGLFHLP